MRSATKNDRNADLHRASAEVEGEIHLGALFVKYMNRGLSNGAAAPSLVMARSSEGRHVRLR